MPLIEITIYKSGKSLDEAIAEAVLTKLGIKSPMLMQQFMDSYSYANLKDFFKEVINNPKNATTFKNIAKAVNRTGKSTFDFEVSDSLISDVKEFLAVEKRKVSDHLNDSVRQSVTGRFEADAGEIKNTQEGLRDMDQGAGQTARGLYHSLTDPVGSSGFNSGLDNVWEGVSRFAKGGLKLTVQNPFDEFAMTTGGYFDATQTALGLQSIGRSLNMIERQILANIYGHSLVLDVIRIKQGYAGLYHIGLDQDSQANTTFIRNYRAMTRGNTIYMKYLNPGSERWKSVLVHESTHVWQAQNGGTDYISEAVYAQVFGDGYNYQKGINEAKTWAMLNPEQQARLIQVAYAGGYFKTNVFVDENGNVRPDLAKYMVNVLLQLRSGQGAT
jgi:Domain of unknown function (DUF4157)